jgi:hypothetical protein
VKIKYAVHTELQLLLVTRDIMMYNGQDMRSEDSKCPALYLAHLLHPATKYKLKFALLLKKNTGVNFTGRLRPRRKLRWRRAVAAGRWRPKER